MIKHCVEFPMLYSGFSLIIYLIYSINPNLPTHPIPSFPLWCPYVCSLPLFLYSCFVNKSTYTNFFQIPHDRHITSACTQRSAPQRKPPYLKHRISPLYPVLLFFIVFITIKSILYICLYLFASVPNKFQKGKNSVLFTTLSFPLFTEDVL